MLGIPKFQDKRGEDPITTTSEYWNRFTDAISLKLNEDVDASQKKQEAEQTLTVGDQKVLKMARGAFLGVLGEHAVRRIKEKNPRIEIYSQTLTWLKKQQPRRSKDPTTTLRDHWDYVQEATAKCKLDEVTQANLDKVMAVAAFTHSIRKSPISAQIWEKH